MKNTFNEIADSMSSLLASKSFTDMFSSESYMKKSASKQEESLKVEAQASHADCLCCGKTREGWTESTGLCKCAASNGCDPVMGCKDNCSCGCKVKKASNSNDALVKSAFDNLMKVSNDLEDAGFDKLAAYTLVLMEQLVSEAADKKDPKAKERLEKERAKAKEEKEKARAKAEKDRNAVRDKAMKEKERAKLEKEKARAKAEKDRNAAKDKAAKEKEKFLAMKEKERAAKEKAKK